MLNDRGFDGNFLCEQQSSRATVLYQTYSYLGSKVMQGKVELVFKRIEVRGYCCFTEPVSVTLARHLLNQHKSKTR